MTLQQVKAARPSLEYDGIYGATTGKWTTDMFLETIYREVSSGNSVMALLQLRQREGFSPRVACTRRLKPALYATRSLS